MTTRRPSVIYFDKLVGEIEKKSEEEFSEEDFVDSLIGKPNKHDDESHIVNLIQISSNDIDSVTHGNSGYLTGEKHKMHFLKNSEKGSLRVKKSNKRRFHRKNYIDLDNYMSKEKTAHTEHHQKEHHLQSNKIELEHRQRSNMSERRQRSDMREHRHREHRQMSNMSEHRQRSNIREHHQREHHQREHQIREHRQREHQIREHHQREHRQREHRQREHRQREHHQREHHQRSNMRERSQKIYKEHQSKMSSSNIGILSNKNTLKEITNDNIVITHFKEENLTIHGYLIHLSKEYFRQIKKPGYHISNSLNPRSMWEKINKSSNDFIVLSPKEIILCKPIEQINSVNSIITFVKSVDLLKLTNITIEKCSGVVGMWMIKITNSNDFEIKLNIGIDLAYVKFLYSNENTQNKKPSILINFDNPEELATEELATEELATEELATEELATEELATEELATEK
jgi:deoxycytidine triphosphate deaminase